MSCLYPENLRFTCTKCGLCCGNTKKKTRHILLLRSEAEQIAVSSRLRISEFSRKIKGRAPYLFEMRKSQESGKCVFLSENRCTIYCIRPLVCRFYPFEMRENEAGDAVFHHTLECPGLGEGDLLLEGYFKRLLHIARVNMNGKSESP